MDKSNSKEELLQEINTLQQRIIKLQKISRKRRQIEKALRESEERFRQLTTAGFEGIIIHEQGTILQINQFAADLFGYQPAELIGTDVLNLAHPQSRPLIQHKIVTGNTEPYEAIGLRQDGSSFVQEIHARIITYQGRPVRVAAVRDISNRKETEEALRIQKKYQEELFEASPDAIVILDNNDNILSLNREFKRLFEFSEAEAIGRQINDLIVPENLRHESVGLTTQVARGERIDVETVRLSKTGKLIEVSITGKPVILQDNQLAVYGIYRDITDRKRAERVKAAAYRISEAALTASDLDVLMSSIHRIIGELIPANNFYIALFDSIADVISFPYFVDEYDESPAPKKPGKGLTEYVLRTGQPLLATPEKFGELEKQGEVESIGAPSVDWLGVPLKMKDKTIGVLTVQSYTEGVRFGEEEKNILVFVSTQIAMAIERKSAEEERQRLEEQLLQAQKMEAIGTLAGGIAHDFNNILSAIIGYSELALMKIPEDNKARDYLHQVLSASDRAKETIKQILAFSRKGEKEQRPTYLNVITTEAIKLLRSTLPATIEIHPRVEKMEHPVMANPIQIHQVIMNLCTNAAYAMRKNGGILEILLQEIYFDPVDVKHREMTPGRYARLTISDTGTGMTAEIKSRIFEPYFTTKQHGEGTGMGLAVVHGIVKLHGGQISVYSEAGKGTTFHLYFPTTAPDDDTARESEDKPPLTGGSERILFVDDEKPLAEVGSRMLENLGYRVETFTGSEEAFDRFRSDPQAFDLVITDQTMPRLTGVQLAGKIKNIRPHIPVILCTGFSENVNEENYKVKGITSFLMKPLTSEMLGRTVRMVLERQ